MAGWCVPRAWTTESQIALLSFSHQQIERASELSSLEQAHRGVHYCDMHTYNREYPRIFTNATYQYYWVCGHMHGDHTQTLLSARHRGIIPRWRTSLCSQGAGSRR